ncbi:probable basic-leucine zipper transcription factor D isoform X5 [Drosophila tropicalis]|uniref:probable basic-leucine zipper transcription factor D isoform X5 n=1 Tax=Drosophila tropicalis TaxID=46794 RepID=UPI0035AC017D
MNNFTTTTAAAPPPGTKESLPRSGHVNEVCKEWLVREDGALAYKLQSQEINDFYKGNRYRNAVVREDFPTALHEQIKEKEQAQRQVDDYRRRLTEQEEHDKRVAKEIADKLERDLQEQQQRELDQSELIAKQMQEIYVNLPPVPPPATRDTSRPPPRPAKASIHHQQHPQQQQVLTNGHHEPSTSQQSRYQHEQQQQHQPLQLQQKHFSQTDNYVGLSLIPNIVDMPATAAAAVAAAVTTTTAAAAAAATTATSTPSRHTQSTHSQLLLSPEKYDQLVGNFGLPTGTGAANGSSSSSSNSKAVERHMQQHADDIELYVDPCDYASLREIGLPMDEIKEMSKKLKQEQKDELLARRLQAIESKDCVRQEHRDRMLAIEAQDKELAKMLQDREKAKAKRAKEKARLRKSQQKEAAAAANGGVSINGNGLLCGASSHCGPLLALPQDCMAMSQSTHSQADIDVEAYSNPIDVLNSSREQRQPNGTLTNGSLTRDGGSNHSSMQRQQRLAQATSLSRGEDDIYTLPVDSCRPGQQRPVSLHMAAETVQQMQTHNSMTRSEHYGSEAGSHDSSIQNGHDISPHMKYSKSGNFGIYIKAPAPRHLTCQFKVLDDQILVKIVKRNPRTTNARISRA